MPTRAFTLLELMVSMALVIVVLAAVAQTFNISSDAATGTAADIDVLAASAAFRETASDQLSKMAPGLLIIESPAPTTARREVSHGPRIFRLRHDRLVFLTNGEVDEYQSFTDPTRGTPQNPNLATARSTQALVYFGPGTPLTARSLPVIPRSLDDDADPLSFTLTAAEWVFLHRSILLLLEPGPNRDPGWIVPTLDDLQAAGGMLDGGPLDPAFRDGTMDAIASNADLEADLVARTETIVDLVQQMPVGDLLSPTPRIAALWEPSLAPRTVSLNDINNADYFTRSGSSFIQRFADFRIQWTDGRTADPLGPDGIANTGDEGGTLWYGLRPDPLTNVNNNAIDTGQIPHVAYRRLDFAANAPQEEIDAFNEIEWVNAPAPAQDAAYRAIWRLDHWRYRPKALRFTYRIYAEAERLKHTAEIDLDEDGDFDPDDLMADTTRRIVTRYGRPFSIVVNLP